MLDKLNFIISLLLNKFLNFLSIKVSPRHQWIHTKLLQCKTMLAHRSAPLTMTLRPWTTRHDYVTGEAWEITDYYNMIMPGNFKKEDSDLPAVNVVINELFARDQFKQDPKLTMLFAVFTNWFAASVLQSNLDDQNKTHIDHGLNLTALYGKVDRTRKTIRNFTNGLLKSQIINGEEYPPYLSSMTTPPPAVYDGQR